LGLGGGGGGGGGTGGATIAPTELPSKKKRNNSNMTFIITVALQLPKLELVVNAAKDDQHKILDMYIYIYIHICAAESSHGCSQALHERISQLINECLRGLPSRRPHSK
jgi:hypothetical protein